MIAGVNLVTSRSRLSGDTAIGLLFVGMLAPGVVMVSRSSTFCCASIWSRRTSRAGRRAGTRRCC
jgi:ABC-type Mn2+/Zn2+ transport system permease subunit